MAIEFDGEFTVDTSRDAAFAVLSDVQKFSPMLPTYQSHELCDDGSCNVTVKVGVGKIRGNAIVNLALTEHKEPVSATYAGKGKIMGGAFNLLAAFDLHDAGHGGTRIVWRGELTIFGKLVSLAGGLIKPVAGKQIQELVDAIQASLAGAVSPADQRSRQSQ
ncbi:MAG: SRPBCC domain-containing protein [Woeseia sp.]